MDCSPSCIIQYINQLQPFDICNTQQFNHWNHIATQPLKTYLLPISYRDPVIILNPKFRTSVLKSAQQNMSTHGESFHPRENQLIHTNLDFKTVYTSELFYENSTELDEVDCKPSAATISAWD